MRLEHLNLFVKDMDKTMAFYGAAFPHWRIRTKGSGDWHGHPRNWLHFGDDYNYLSLNDNADGEMRPHESHSVGMSHMGFVVTNIYAMIDRLRTAGFEIAKPGADNPHRRNVYFNDPDGFEVEFVEYSSDLPIERNSD